MEKRPTTAKKTKCLALSAMLTALSAAILCLGALLDVAVLSAAALSSLAVLFARREMGHPYDFMIYGGVTLLSFLLLPNPGAVLYFALFFGIYALLWFPLARLPRLLSFVLRFLFCNGMFAAVELLGIFLFSLPAEAWYIYLVLFLIGNPTFFLYQYLLTRLLILYDSRYHARVAKFLS